VFAIPWVQSTDQTWSASFQWHVSDKHTSRRNCWKHKIFNFLARQEGLTDRLPGAVRMGVLQLVALELWVVRHGESTGNRDGVLQGQSDYPLTDLGTPAPP
jgi:hypothetical protein